MLTNIRMALGNLASNKLRTGLTMLGVTIGVAAVIILVSVGQSFEIFVRQQFEGIGVNLIFVIPTPTSSGQINPLTFNDLDALSSPARVPDALRVMPQTNLTRAVRVGSRELRQVTVQAVTPDFPDLFGRSVVLGRFFDEGELDTSARVAIIEQGIVEKLFPDSFPIGQAIRIGNVQFTIVGVLDQEAGAFGFGDSDNVVIPITTAQTRLSNQRVLTGEQSVGVIIAQGRDPENASSVTLQIQQTLRERRDISFRDEDDFIVLSQSELINTLDDITALLTAFLAILASISLIVGGIGIMNIMLVTVTERTREIGLRKAVGAQNRDILLQFLTEAVILSVLGGIVGVLIAVLGALAASTFIPELVVTVQPQSVILATVISIVVGMVSGIYPANRAANLNPIDALRYE